MALKHRIEKLEEVGEAFRGLYEQAQDGKFYLQVEGMSPNTKLDEFRENNIRLTNELNLTKEKFKDIDPVRYAEMVATVGKTPEQIENAVKARTAALTAEYQGKEAELTGKLASLSGQLNTVLIDGTLKSEAAKAGVLVTALDDVVLRGRMVYSLNDKNEMVAKDAKGQVLYDTDGTSNLNVGNWLKGLKKNAPHLFEGMRGSGGGGNNGGTGGTGFDMSKASAVGKISEGLKNLGSGHDPI